MTFISLYKNAFDKIGEKIEFQSAIDIIKSDQLKKQIDEIVSTKDKSIRNKLKSKLQAITVSGLFTRRNKDSIVIHSGLIQIDIDDIQDYNKCFNQLIKDQYTYIAFKSPSGNGIKLIVKIPNDVNDHINQWNSLNHYFKSTYNIDIDKQTKDVSRLMYLSHDPNLFQNDASLLYKATSHVNKDIQQVSNVSITSNTDDVSKVRSDIKAVINEIESYKIDITNGYENWRNIGFVLADLFGEEGRQFYHSISQYNSSYQNEDCNIQFDKCLKSNGNGVSHKTFFQIAKDHQIQNNGNNTKKVDASGAIQTLDKVDCPKSKLDVNGFFEESGRYFTQNGKTKRPITNFTAQLLYHFPDGSNNSTRLFKVINSQNGEKLIELSDKEISSMQSFKAALRSKGNYSFLGSLRDLDNLTTVLGEKEVTAEKIMSLGYLKDHKVYAFANGVLDVKGNFLKVDDFGVIKLIDKSIYIPSGSKLNAENEAYSLERNFSFNRGSIAFEKWSNLMIEAYGKKGIVASAFLVASFFRDIVFDHVGHFPYLFLFGGAGGGKTTFSNFLLRPFVSDPQKWALSCSSTEKAIGRKITTASNSIFYIKEFNLKVVKDSLVEFFKNLFDGVGYDRAQTTNNNKTHQTAINSAIVLDGNFLPTQQSALFDRIVLLNFDKQEFEEKSKVAKDELLELLDGGSGNILAELFAFRSLVKKSFQANYKLIQKQLKNIDPSFSNRTIDNLSCIITPIKCIIDQLNISFNESDLINVFADIAKNHSSILNSIEEINVFWQSIQQYYQTKDYGDPQRDGLFKRDNDFGLNLNSYFPKYIEYGNENNIKNLLDKATLNQLINNSPYLIDKSKSITYNGISYRVKLFKLSVLEE